ncbi:hypothetical protein LBMAG15_19150 [Actinomycetes bacterium]|nr:hypothetical protein LBMAG15_19150 [Actinomycetes bacterium]
MRQYLIPAKANNLHAQAGGPDTKKINQERNIQQLPIKLVVDNCTTQKNWPQAASGQGPATGFKHPT